METTAYSGQAMNLTYLLGKPTQALDYAVIDSPYGPTLCAWSEQRLCYLGFTDNINDLSQRWPQAQLQQQAESGHAKAIFSDSTHHDALPRCLYGTDFEHQVWRALQNIPTGHTRSYSEIATAIGKPTAQRAVASAIGRNPISLLVPCHRVVRASGELGGYHWGLDKKIQILEFEKNTLASSL